MDVGGLSLQFVSLRSHTLCWKRSLSRRLAFLRLGNSPRSQVNIWRYASAHRQGNIDRSQLKNAHTRHYRKHKRKSDRSFLQTWFGESKRLVIHSYFCLLFDNMWRRPSLGASRTKGVVWNMHRNTSRESGRGSKRRCHVHIFLGAQKENAFLRSIIKFNFVFRYDLRDFGLHPKIGRCRQKQAVQFKAKSCLVRLRNMVSYFFE